MKMTYVSRIQANIKRYQSIKANRATDQILDGSYRSLVKGRSMNFDELREYVPGDDIKDMDWKASARSQKFFVRQYIAEKKHNVLLIMDTNRAMLGHSDGLEEKRDLAIMGAGTLAYFVNRNGDYVSAIMAHNKGIQFFPFKTGLGNIEVILESYHKAVDASNTSNINDSIDYVIRNFKRRMIILVVTDVAGISRISDQNIKRLLVAHDVLFLNISDASIQDKKVWEMDKNGYLPSFFTRSKRLREKTHEAKMSLINSSVDRLGKYGIPCSTIDYIDELDKEIIDLLAKHKLVKR